MRNLFVVGLGGLLGTLVRYVLQEWQSPYLFPWFTLLTNISGSFLLGALTAWLHTRQRDTEWMKLGLGTGFCGGFTTMSTLTADFYTLLEHHTLAVSYIVLSFGGGILSAYAGMLLVMYIKRRSV